MDVTRYQVTVETPVTTLNIYSIATGKCKTTAAEDIEATK